MLQFTCTAPWTRKKRLEVTILTPFDKAILVAVKVGQASLKRSIEINQKCSFEMPMEVAKLLVSYVADSTSCKKWAALISGRMLGHLEAILERSSKSFEDS